MLNPAVINSLEEIAKELRKVLEFDSEVILNPNHFKELSQKIQRDEHYKIIEDVAHDGDSYMILDKDDYFSFYIFGGKIDNFYDLIEMYTYAIILDKKKLTLRELKHKVFTFPRPYYESRESEYLMRAFMIPAQTFKSMIVKYESSPGRCSVEKMQNELNNKYCYKRGQDLHFWIP